MKNEKYFDATKTIGGYAQHDIYFMPGRKIWEQAASLCKEQAACRIPENYRTRVVYGRRKARISTKHPVEQIGYDYWIYIPFDEDYAKEGM